MMLYIAVVSILLAGFLFFLFPSSAAADAIFPSSILRSYLSIPRNIHYYCCINKRFHHRRCYVEVAQFSDFPVAMLTLLTTAVAALANIPRPRLYRGCF